MFDRDPAANLAALVDLARALGFADAGFAPLPRIRDACHPSLLESLPPRATGAVALVFPLSSGILDSLIDRPTPLYSFHYNRANAFIDSRCLDLMTALQAEGRLAIPIPASQVVDRGSQHGHVMHKLVAHAAGLGWIGRSNLLVTPRHGARIRLASLFTDLPLPELPVMDDRCGACDACVRRCPAGAIGDTPGAFRLDLCATRLRGYQRIMFVSKDICGICQSACRGPKERAAISP